MKYTVLLFLVIIPIVHIQAEEKDLIVLLDCNVSELAINETARLTVTIRNPKNVSQYFDNINLVKALKYLYFYRYETGKHVELYSGIHATVYKHLLKKQQCIEPFDEIKVTQDVIFENKETNDLKKINGKYKGYLLMLHLEGVFFPISNENKEIIIQAKIRHSNKVIESNKIKLKLNFNNYSNVKIDWASGTVTSSGGNSPGAQLIYNLQNNKNTVTIEEGSIGTKPKSRKDAETLGKGPDSTVFFSMNIRFKAAYYLKDKDGNISKSEVPPLEIALGHELIHGLHYAEGSGDNSTDNYVFMVEGFINGKYRSGKSVLEGGPLKDKYPREEARTIGIGEYRNDLITENALRRQLRYDKEKLTH